MNKARERPVDANPKNPLTVRSGWWLLPVFSAVLLGCSSDVVAADQLPDPPDLVEERSETVSGADGVGLTVYEVGNRNGPAVVFVHSFSQNYLTWDRQVSGPLAQEFHLVGFDMRGHGTSEKPLDPGSYTSPEVWADDLAAVLQARSLERPVLVGSS